MSIRISFGNLLSGPDNRPSDDLSLVILWLPMSRCQVGTAEVRPSLAFFGGANRFAQLTWMKGVL